MENRCTDIVFGWRRCAQMFQETYLQSKRHNLTVVRYPNTGHLKEPPYLPVTSSNKKTYEDDVFGKKMQKGIRLYSFSLFFKWYIC